MTSTSWADFKLDELGSVGRGRSRYRPRDAAFLYGGDYPFFQTGDVKSANFYLSEYSQTYNEHGLAQSRLWQPGTLCITIAANIAETAILAIPGCFPDSVVGFVPDPAKADVRFVKYAIDTLKLAMQSASRGTTQDNLSVDKLLSFRFRAPPLSTQSRIAEVLSAYDELIENNRRRIRILEEMARAVYREWFVNFRFPGHESVDMVDSSLGPIPRGWHVGTVSAVCALTMGQSPKSEFYNESGEGLPFHQGVSDFGDRSPVDRLFCTAQGRIAEPGDILFSVRAPVGRLNIADKRIVIGRGLSAIRHRRGYQAFLWEQLRSRFTRDDMMGNGAIFAAVTKSDVEGIELLCPPDALVRRATELLQPLHDQLAILVKQSAVLRRTRDLLLPRLMSGQLAVDALPD